jgi:hypothetical protein
MLVILPSPGRRGPGNKSGPLRDDCLAVLLGLPPGFNARSTLEGRHCESGVGTDLYPRSRPGFSEPSNNPLQVESCRGLRGCCQPSKPQLRVGLFRRRRQVVDGKCAPRSSRGSCSPPAHRVSDRRSHRSPGAPALECRASSSRGVVSTRRGDVAESVTREPPPLVSFRATRPYYRSRLPLFNYLYE